MTKIKMFCGIFIMVIANIFLAYVLSANCPLLCLFPSDSFLCCCLDIALSAIIIGAVALGLWLIVF